jgi:dTDP-glucose pyrophosphorylase
MNIIIPMAGEGKRLAHLGYKPLIQIKGKPMIQWAVESLGITGDYIFIIKKEFLNDLEPVLNKIVPDCLIIGLDETTQGPAETVLKAKEFINTDEPLITANCDQYIEWNSGDFLKRAGGYDGCILTYGSSETNGSYCILKDRFVTKTAEKEVISDIATVGIYYFGKGRDCVTAIESMIKKNIRANNEFYMAPVYNELITKGKKIVTYYLPEVETGIRQVWRIGVPEELDAFLKDRP